MKKIIIAVISIILIGIAGYRIFIYESDSVYYTQIDNSKMKKINTDGGVVNFKGSLPYSYTLTCYNSTGKKKKLQFTADKKLREDAFICLNVNSVRGVVSWNEVQYYELPLPVQEKYE